jgi:hypothetical protein
MLPAQRCRVGEQRLGYGLACGAQVCDGIDDVGRIPIDDGGDDQVQPRGPELLCLRAAVGDATLLESANDLGEEVALLALLFSPAWQRRRSSGSPFRCGPAVSIRRPSPRPPGSRTKSFHTCQGLRPRRAGRPLALTRSSMSPSVFLTTSAPDTLSLSRLHGWPMCSPTDASTQPSRFASHGSGSMRFATPSSWRTFTPYSLPVSPAHQKFLSTHAAVYNTFNVQRHLISAQTHRTLRAAAMDTWRTAVAAA